MIPARPLEGKRILVLEDDFFLAKDEQALLEQAGAEVVGPLGSAQQGSGLPGEGRLDGAVVDINPRPRFHRGGCPSRRSPTGALLAIARPLLVNFVPASGRERSSVLVA